ncbi:hypothetical protein MPER_12962 [Moniliophthora perniciosa FA553]|nr:hypothetical protein MPER_12962 [Moniliophthora perniciosa FA553]
MSTPMKQRIKSVSLIFACGTALFSDGTLGPWHLGLIFCADDGKGYANGVISSVNTLLKRVYGEDAIQNHDYITIVNSLTFAGTVVGMLVFGWLSDKIGRKFGMETTVIVALFSGLSAASTGANHSLGGMLAMLSACRFLLGIGVGAEYPCGSVSASEQTEEKGVSKNAQHRWFALATNSMIDFGFVISAFVPLVLFWIFGDNHLRAVWRLSLGLGVVPALLVLIWRIGLEEPERYKRDSMRNAKIPYRIILKAIRRFPGCDFFTWFLYDFIVYPFGIYTSTILDRVTGGSTALSVVFGWNVVINLFYMPGTLGGAIRCGLSWPEIHDVLSDYGFGVSGSYRIHHRHGSGALFEYDYTEPASLLIADLVGTLLSELFRSFQLGFILLGELGPGNCLGLLASKSSPTAVRGQFYGVAAAIGKVGAFVGTWAFPAMIDAFGGSTTVKGNTGPFWVGSGLAILSALVTFFFIRPLSHDGMTEEDVLFREYLEHHGYDTSQMGLGTASEVTDSASEDEKKVPV